MSTTTDTHGTDEATIAYVEWLQLSAAVQDACDRWRRGDRGDATVSFAAYTQVLDREERSALESGEFVAGSSPVGGE
jgi:hypothetical protein